ncbi:MAG: hypothetical protein B7Y34_06560 [Methylophilales bacterium 16-45-9]|nr:MAG: hypothetical protein B7Y34_06560 [Methylophilales bacterium 16-45-9]
MMTWRKTLLWMVVMWFALLETVTPFIHAHLEADQPHQPHGLHIHEMGLAEMPDTEHTLKNIEIPLHTVVVTQALVKNVDALPLPIFALLFVLSLSLLITRFFKSSDIQHSQLPIYLRSCSRPRAPPL